MAGPWEQFQSSAPAQEAAPTEGPWSKFAAPAEKPQGASQFEPMIQAASQAHGVPVEDIRAIIGTESSWNPKAKSPKSAAGLMQLMPRTAAELGVTDPYDPAQNIEAGTRYYKQMLDKYGDQSKALAAYNWGPGNVDKFGDNYTKAMPKETRDYVRKITAQMGIRKPGDTSSELGRGAAGLHRGLFQDLPDAATQGVSALIPDQLERALSVEDTTGSEQVAKEEALYQQHRAEMGGEGIDLGRLAGNIVNPASLALGASPPGAVARMAGPTLANAARIGEVAPTVGKAAAQFAKLSPKAQAVLGPMLRGGAAGAMMPVEGTDEFAVQKAKQMGIGAALGPVAEGAGRVIGKVAGRVMGARANEIQPGAAASQKLGDEFGVQLSAGDLAPNSKALTGIEGGLENLRIPLAGMSQFRTGQQEQAKAAAQSLLDKEHKALKDLTFQSIDRVRAIAQGNGPRAKEAAKIVQMVDKAGDDEKLIMKASGNLMWLNKKISADKLFKERDVLAGAEPVPPLSSLKVIDEGLQKLPNEVDVDTGAVSLLQKWRGQLDGTAGNPATDPLEDAVNFMDGTAPEGAINTYARMKSFSSAVQTRIAAARKDGTTPAGKTFLSKVGDAVNKDLDAFESNIPGLKDAAGRASSFYERNVIPYQERKLAKALTKRDPDSIYGAFVRSQAEGKGAYAAEHFFKALDNKGKQAVRYGIVKQAMDNALEGGDFSPGRFRQTLQGAEFKTYFAHPTERARVERLADLFGHLRHADPEHIKKYAPMMGGMQGLGSMGMASAVGAAAVGNLPAAGAAALGGIGSARMLRWLMTSDSGKRLLFSKDVLAKGGSRESAGKLLDKLMRQFSMATGTAAGAETGQPGRVLP